MMICTAELSRDVVFTAWVAVCDTDDEFCFDEKTFVAGTVVNVHDVFKISSLSSLLIVPGYMGREGPKEKLNISYESYRVMIKSSKLTIKFANSGKKKNLNTFIQEYRNVVSLFVDILWEMEKVPVLLPKEITDQVESWLSARAIQCAGKQASGIVRGTRKKQDQRRWRIKKLLDEGKNKQARKLEFIDKKKSISKPNIDTLCPELDSRFVTIDFNDHTSFDGFVILSSLGNKLVIKIPLKKHKHFNSLLARGTLKGGVRISTKSITFMFEIETKEKRSAGTIIGIDVGHCNVLSCSNGAQSQKNKDGHDLTTINNILSRKTKGSKGFKRTQKHRTNYINWSINQLNLSDVKEVRLENISNLRKGMRSSRLLSHWTYTEIFAKLESYCLDAGVQIKKVSPTYTSQRCSVCGWTRKANRKGKQFKCKSCGHTMDADLNASLNISFDLAPIKKQERLQQKNRTGFYWLVVGQEHIVPDVLKSI